MPKGPNGEKRPADLIGMSVVVAKIATAEIEDNKKSRRTRSDKSGTKVRAQRLTNDERTEIARKVANTRWG